MRSGTTAFGQREQLVPPPKGRKAFGVFEEQRAVSRGCVLVKKRGVVMAEKPGAHRMVRPLSVFPSHLAVGGARDSLWPAGCQRRRIHTHFSMLLSSPGAMC